MSTATAPAKPNTIGSLRTCSCRRPKAFGYQTKCELCKFYGLETEPSRDLYKWIEDRNPLNPQVKQLGFSAEPQVCANCVHFKKIDHKNRIRYERWKTVCVNSIDDKTFKPYWPACHNFQPRPAKPARKQKVTVA